MTQNWYLPLAVMAFILGAFIALALKTENKVRGTLPSEHFSGLAEAYLMNKTTSTAILALEQTISDLRSQNEKLAASSSRAPREQALADELRQAQAIAGLTPVEGPGVTVTLNDSPKRPPSDIPDAALRADLTENFMIHDADIRRVVDELRAAGAEALSINNQRVVATTAVRCVGPVILVNDVPFAPPYVIQAIGNSQTLYKALNLPGGVVDGYTAWDPAMISVVKQPKIALPAYAGAAQMRYIHPVGDIGARSAAPL